MAVVSAIAGVILLWLILRNFFTVSVTIVTSLIVVFGTNYFRWIFFDGATPHNFLFTLFAGVVLLTINWHRDHKWIWLILIFPVVLLACYIHDLSMFILFFPLLYGLHDNSSWEERLQQIREQKWQWLFLLFIVVGAFGLTRFAWFAEPGTEFYFGDKKASVYPWIAANFYLILFSFNKGWIIYTPMVLLALPGMYLLAERNRGLLPGVFLFFILWFMLAASHPLWNAGPGFGQRFFIETYVVLSLPLGYLVQWIFERRPWLRITLLIFPLFFLLLNIFQTWQYTNNIILAEGMNRDYYQAVFGKLTDDPASRKLLYASKRYMDERIPENVKYRVTRLEAWEFETPLPGYEPYFETRVHHTGIGSWRLCKEKAFSPELSRKVANLTIQDTVWVRVTAWLYFECHRAENHVNLVFACTHKGAAYKYVVKNFADKLQPGIWNYICYDYQLPLHLQDRQDEVHAYFWNYGERDCFIDDYTIDLFEPETKR